MKSYTISEALEKWTIDTLVYQFKGKIKGALMWADQNNGNRIVVAYPDGTVSYGLHIAIEPNATKEDSKCLVFFNEMQVMTLNMDEFKIYEEMNEAITKVAKGIEEEVNHLPEEEQKEIREEWARQHAEYIKRKIEEHQNY